MRVLSGSVTVDHFGGVDAATRYLLKLGHRRIALLVGDVKAFSSRSRVEGFQAAFAAGKHKIDPGLLSGRSRPGRRVS